MLEYDVGQGRKKEIVIEESSDSQCLFDLCESECLDQADEIAGDIDDIKCHNIRKHVNNLLEEIDIEEKIHDIVERTLNSNKELHEEDKHDILTKVETQHENLREVLSYTEYLLGAV